MSNQDISTPPIFIKGVEELFKLRFKYDMAANEENTKCETWFSDSLERDWPTDGWCWLNPPFQKTTQFVKKCKEQMDRGCNIVSIWPLSGDLNQIITWKSTLVNVIHGRVWSLVRGCMLCKWDGMGRGVQGLRWDGERLTKEWRT